MAVENRKINIGNFLGCIFVIVAQMRSENCGFNESLTISGG